MPAFIAGSANNDALAMLTATAVFAAVLRAQRLGWTWRRGVGLILLLLLALASKKTNSFLLPVVNNHRPGAWLALAETSCLAAPRHGEDRSRRLACRHHPALAGEHPCKLAHNRPALGGTTARCDCPPAAGCARKPGCDRDRSFAAWRDPGHHRPIGASAARPDRANQGVCTQPGCPTHVRTAHRPDAAGFSQVEFIADNQWQSVAISRRSP